MPKMLLPDINVWLALAFDAHAHHEPAKRWFETLEDDICFFCRMTQQGFLRLASNPAVFGNDALTLIRAWEIYDLFLTDSRVSFAREPSGIEQPWRSFTQRTSFSAHVWNDAYLAAFAAAASMELVSFDKAMTQYQPVACTILV